MQTHWLPETGLTWWWVRSQETHGQAGGGRTDPRRECGGLSQSCESPAANSCVNLSVRASSCWGWRREDRHGSGPRPQACGPRRSVPPSHSVPVACWSSAPGRRSSGTARDSASSSSLPWEQSWESALMHCLCCGTAVTPAWSQLCVFTFCSLKSITGLVGWLSGKEFACQCRRPRRHGFDPWIERIPWRGKWQLTPVFLPGESRGQRSLAAAVHRITESDRTRD